MNYSNQDTDEKYPADVIITDGDIRKFMTPEEDHNETPEEDHNETPEEGHNEYEFDKYQTIRWFLHFLPIPPQFNRLTEENNNSHMTLT